MGFRNDGTALESQVVAAESPNGATFKTIMAFHNACFIGILTGWWFQFQIFFSFTSTWGFDPTWRIFLKWFIKPPTTLWWLMKESLHKVGSFSSPRKKKQQIDPWSTEITPQRNPEKKTYFSYPPWKLTYFLKSGMVGSDSDHWWTFPFDIFDFLLPFCHFFFSFSVHFREFHRWIWRVSTHGFQREPLEAQWPPAFAERVAELALSCTQMQEDGSPIVLENAGGCNRCTHDVSVCIYIYINMYII